MTVCVHFCEAFSTRRRQVGDVKMRVGIAFSARFWLRFLIKFAKCPRLKFKVMVRIIRQMKDYKITMNKKFIVGIYRSTSRYSNLFLGTHHYKIR